MVVFGVENLTVLQCARLRENPVMSWQSSLIRIRCAVPFSAFLCSCVTQLLKISTLKAEKETKGVPKTIASPVASIRNATDDPSENTPSRMGNSQSLFVSVWSCKDSWFK